MNVLIVGANGTTGNILVEKLGKSSEHKAVAMVRKEEQKAKMEQLGADEIVIADLEKDIEHAVKGMDAVIFAAGSGSKTGPDKTYAVDQEGAKQLVNQAEKHGVKRFVMLSSMGAGNPDATSDQNMKVYLEAKGSADEHLQKSSLSYVIVRPGPLSNDTENGQIEAQEKIEDMKDRSIPRADVANVLIESLTNEHVTNKIFEILSGERHIEEALGSM
ncbi:SDR family oxidoreductase [Priestia endophytica]|uniref:SDR family oxidoreductase n=1 Tax=Priestia endophytica TaxID=135735 RepID=UPI000F51BC41|nr:SDR family oxidoreductase [Priestia endophytica]RPK12487.1 hypothetical protein FH5_02692 [Priestia endophytica]